MENELAQGTWRLNLKTAEGSKCMIRMQVTNVKKSLMSVSKVCDQGHRVVFEKECGYIEHLETGQRTRFNRRNGVYVLDVEVEPAPFNRPGN